MEICMIRTWHPMNNKNGGYWSYALYDNPEAAEQDWPMIEEGYKKAELLKGTLTVIRAL